MPATPGYVVHVLVEGKSLESLEISANASTSEVQSAFRSIAGITEGHRDSTILKLYRSDGVLVPIGPHIPPTAPDAPYSLRIKEGTPPNSNSAIIEKKPIEKIISIYPGSTCSLATCD
jgi:hypothetical protein